MFHHWVSADEGYTQCIRCGGSWSDERLDGASWCVAEATEFGSVHGSATLDEKGHDLDCADYEEHGGCKHIAVEHGCNCDECEYM